jgi:hypothetical protein
MVSLHHHGRLVISSQGALLMHPFECLTLKKFLISEKMVWRTDTPSGILSPSGILWAGSCIKYVAFHPGGGLTIRQITDGRWG